jgi:metallo-beta-lactamase family protein
VVLAGSGFCDAGPILHHFQDGLPKPHVRVGLSGWHPEGSLGWGLLHDCSHARIDGEEVEVLADMRRLEGYSGHANAEELAAWAGSGPTRPETIVLNHGTDASRDALGERLRSAGHDRLLAPVPNERTVC